MWSVQVTGVATPVRDVSVLVRLEQLGLGPWVGCGCSHWVRIWTADVTGRQIAAAGPFAAAV